MKVFTLLFLLIASSVFAGEGDKGNITSTVDLLHSDGFYGGDAVVCREKNGKIKSAHLLDYAEKGLVPDDMQVEYDKRLSDEDFIRYISNKLEKVAPDVFVSFRREAEKLARQFSTYGTWRYKARKDVVFIPKANLVQVADSKEATVMNLEGCNVEQLVIRQKHFNSVDYIVQEEIFKKLSKRDKRGLVLHEAIYHSFNMYYNDKDSVRTRYFHRGIMQFKLKDMKETEIMNYLKESFIKF